MNISATQIVFDTTASSYDQDRAKLIPSHDAFYGWALRLVPSAAKTIMDLGAGTGHLTAMLRQHFPSAKIHLVDFSRPMLDHARERFRDDGNIEFHQIDYTTQPLPADLCAVVSALSIHHCTDDDKRKVILATYKALKRNGVFINAEQVAGPTPAQTDAYNALWLRQIRENGATEEQIQASLYRRREDKCSPVETQLQWMREAGFADADCWYKESGFAVLAGTRR